MSATVDMFLIILSVSFVFTAIVSKLPLLRVPSAVAYLIFGIILHVSLVPLGKEEVRWEYRQHRIVFSHVSVRPGSGHILAATTVLATPSRQSDVSGHVLVLWHTAA
jgi:Kef-type K+ transport system membrane component KefB